MALSTNTLLVLPQQLGPSSTLSPGTVHFNHSQRRYHICRATATPSVSLWFCDWKRKVKTKASNADKQQVTLEEKEEEEFQVLTAMKSAYNDIVIIDTHKARMLLLDSSHNVHSTVYKHQKWTSSYWDEFASLPAIVPKGPIAILGLLEGWEIDQIPTQAGGILNVHIGDALSPSVNISGGYAGIVVNLFSDGKVLPQLQENQLMPNGRLMVNCGGIDCASGVRDETAHLKNISTDHSWLQNSTINTLSKAFPGQVSWKKIPQTFGGNYLALTAPLPESTSRCAAVIGPLTASVKQWRPCEPIS